MAVPLLALGLLMGSPMLWALPQEYRYIEGETYSTTEGSGLRKEGFTSWMAHPSHGAVMVLGGPGNWLEYEVGGLATRPYHLFVRGLAWASGCDVDVYWDGQKLGTTSYAHPVTALRWSREIGVVQGPGEHRLRLVGAPGSHQAPYLDAILLTTQEGAAPGDADQDFVTFTTALPPLLVGAAPDQRAILPQPGGVAGTPAVEVRALGVGPPVFGENEVRVRLAANEPVVLQAEVRFGQGPAASAEVHLDGHGAEVEVPLRAVADRPGDTLLSVALGVRGAALASGTYPVRIPTPVRASLDEYAYPLGAERMTWSTDLSGADPGLAAALTAEVDVRAAGAAEPLFHTEVRAGAVAGPLAVPLTGLGLGRYEVTSRFARDAKAVVEERATITRFAQVPFEKWAPAKTTRARGPVLLLNERPFLGRLLFHAAPTEAVRAHGFNLVQCYGSDPDPLESIQKHLDLCAQSGLWGTVALFNNRFFLPGPGFDRDHLRQAVERFRDHPALFGWDLIDEPDGRDDMTPAEVAECARRVRGLDPNHIVWVNLCRPQRALEWLDSQDLWSYDTYPFPVQGFAGYTPWLKASDASLRGQRPLGTCLQTWQWSAEATLPMPTPDQLRASAWLHVLHGYTWFGCYSYYDPEPAGCLARDPELWSYCRALNSELVALSGTILDPAPFQGLVVESAGSEVEAGAKDSGGVRTVVVVSGAREPRQARIVLPGPAGEAEVLFDAPRRLPVAGGALVVDLRAYGTLVLRIR